MAQDITKIIFDKRTFRRSPFTTHDSADFSSGGGAAILLYEDAEVLKDESHMIKLPDAFAGVAAGGNSGEQKTLSIAMSGYCADPNIDFTLNGRTVSVRAADYLTGLNNLVWTLPVNRADILSDNLDHVIDTYDQRWIDHQRRWSVDFFREKLSGLVDGPDHFFLQIYRGINNAIDKQQKMLIMLTLHDPNKAQYGSFDPPAA